MSITPKQKSKYTVDKLYILTAERFTIISKRLGILNKEITDIKALLLGVIGELPGQKKPNKTSPPTPPIKKYNFMRNSKGRIIFEDDPEKS